jgi:S1-C subfamily serine protease
LVNLVGGGGITTPVVRNTNNGDVAEGLGFAIPVNTAQAVAQQIMEKGYFARPYMGISFQPINPDIAGRYDLPAQWGVYITRVAENSPASKAGLQEGDIITKVGDVPLDGTHSYVNALFSFKPGDQITLEIAQERHQAGANNGWRSTTHLIQFDDWDKKGRARFCPSFFCISYSRKILTCRRGSLP